MGEGREKRVLLLGWNLLHAETDTSLLSDEGREETTANGGKTGSEGQEWDGNAEREMTRGRPERSVHRVQEVEEDRAGK